MESELVDAGSPSVHWNASQLPKSLTSVLFALIRTLLSLFRGSRKTIVNVAIDCVSRTGRRTVPAFTPQPPNVI